MKQVNIIKNKDYRIESFADLETGDCKIIIKVDNVEKSVIEYTLNKSNYKKIAKKIWEKDSVKVLKLANTRNIREHIMQAFIETVHKLISEDLDYSDSFKTTMDYDYEDTECNIPENDIMVCIPVGKGTGEPDTSKLICLYKRDALKIKCFKITKSIGTLRVFTPACPLPRVNIDMHKMDVNQAVKSIFKNFSDDIVELAKINDSLYVLTDALRFLLEELSGYHLEYTKDFTDFLNSSDNEKTLPEICIKEIRKIKI